MQRDDLLNEFEIYLVKERHLSELTVRQYMRVLREYTLDYPKLNPTEESFLHFLKGEENNEDFSKSKWNAQLSALKAYSEFLMRKHGLKINPTENIRRIKIYSQEPDPLSFDEIIRLLKSFEPLSPFYRSRNELIIMILFHSGMRVSELVSLNMGQIDMQARLFYGVRRKRDKVLSSPFNDVVCEYLEKYLTEREKRVQNEEESALILSNRNTRITTRSIQLMIKSYAKKAGIVRPVTPHLMRHSSATELIHLQIPLPVVQGIFGHSSPLTTQRYIHTSNGDRRQAADKLGRAWREATQGNLTGIPK